MATNNDWELDDDFDDEDSQPQSNDGSDLLKKLRRAKRADEKRIKELTEQLEGLSKVQRERVIKEVLDQKGVNPKAARLIMKDLDDITEESVSHGLKIMRICLELRQSLKLARSNSWTVLHYVSRTLLLRAQYHPTNRWMQCKKV